MFENYIHSKRDLKAVEEALEYLERLELDFIFKDRSLIKNTLVISYDSKELFIWTKLKTSKLEKVPCRVKGWNAYRVSHGIKFKDKDQRGWGAFLRFEEMLKYLPAEFRKNTISKISGSLLTPFTTIHKKRREDGFRPLDPYHTRESYLATIIHEFGHAYYNKQNPRSKLIKTKSPGYTDKEETLDYMKLALDLYRRKDKVGLRKKIRLLFPKGFSELFAFCTDYYAASLFWPDHQRNIEQENRQRIKWMVKKEATLDLTEEDSILHDHHQFAMVIGKIIMEKYPNDWPVKLLNTTEAGKL